MKTVLLMRHAKSSWDEWGLLDHKRSLNERGRKDVPKMAAWLADENLQPEWCLSSSAIRAASTAKGLKESGFIQFPLELTDHLYHATPVEVVLILQALPDELNSCLIVAHNPGLEELVAMWSGKPRHFPTGAIAVFDFETITHWSDLTCDLIAQERAFQIPKELA